MGIDLPFELENDRSNRKFILTRFEIPVVKFIKPLFSKLTS